MVFPAYTNFIWRTLNELFILTGKKNLSNVLKCIIFYKCSYNFSFSFLLYYIVFFNNNEDYENKNAFLLDEIVIKLYKQNGKFSIKILPWSVFIFWDIIWKVIIHTHTKNTLGLASSLIFKLTFIECQL